MSLQGADHITLIISCACGRKMLGHKFAHDLENRWRLIGSCLSSTARDSRLLQGEDGVFDFETNRQVLSGQPIVPQVNMIQSTTCPLKGDTQHGNIRRADTSKFPRTLAVRTADGSDVNNFSRSERSGVWGQDEHSRFLVGLRQCGWGRWDDIATFHVLTRSANQVSGPYSCDVLTHQFI